MEDINYWMKHSSFQRRSQFDSLENLRGIIRRPPEARLVASHTLILISNPPSLNCCYKTPHQMLPGLGHTVVVFLKMYLFLTYLFLAALGLCCCTWASSRCGEQGLLFFVVRGLRIVVASLVAEHGL